MRRLFVFARLSSAALETALESSRPNTKPRALKPWTCEVEMGELVEEAGVEGGNDKLSLVSSEAWRTLVNALADLLECPLGTKVL
jgi:hypothetical protein